MDVVSGKSLDLSTVEVFTEPFPYLVSPEAFSADESLEVLAWLETGAPWQLVRADFYEQYEFSIIDAHLPERLAFLWQESFLEDLRERVGSLFRVGLSRRIDLTAHKLVPGQRIRIHNDFVPGQESHRLLIQLNHGWTEEEGGLLLFFNSADPADVHKIFRPAHNSAVGFAITPDSHHAVSAVHGGERFTLVYSFYGGER
jgi:Rps23 Pro-64 3,4-dihydroxylase Tpa1-like proline 4-hydroxylase